MKKLILVGVVALLSSCIEDDGGCVRVTPFGLSTKTAKSSTVSLDEDMVLEYLNANGENIFENGTYDPSQVTIIKNGITSTDVVDLYNEETKYLIWIGGYSEGRNLFAISLAPTDSRIDHLTVFTTQIDFNGCTGPTFSIDSVFYNDEKQNLKMESDGIKKLTITR